MANNKPSPDKGNVGSDESHANDDTSLKWFEWASDHWQKSEANRQFGISFFVASVLPSNTDRGLIKLHVNGWIFDAPISEALKQQIKSDSIGLGDDVLVLYKMTDSIPEIIHISYFKPTRNNYDSFDIETLPKVNFLSKENNAANQHEVRKLPDEERENQLKRIFDTLQKLPTGEIIRIAETSKNRLEKWPDCLPRVAPELYDNRRASERLPDFLRRVYGQREYLNGLLTVAHMEVLDPSCGTAIRNWIKNHKSLPDDINLPNRIEVTKKLPPEEPKLNNK